jgi:cytochrome oxidase Cu insertion factor (SCO1/SenC/PrrC family)
MWHRPTAVSLDVMTTRLTLFVALTILLVVTTGTATGDDEMLQPGQSFPAFELPADDGTTLSNVDLAGRPYLLFFYPKANTGG